MRPASLIAGLAVVNFAGAPLVAETHGSQGRVLISKLCGGGEIRIPIGQPEEEPEHHCPDGKACHAGNCRKQFDSGQRPEEDTD